MCFLQKYGMIYDDMAKYGNSWNWKKYHQGFAILLPCNTIVMSQLWLPWWFFSLTQIARTACQVLDSFYQLAQRERQVLRLVVLLWPMSQKKSLCCASGGLRCQSICGEKGWDPLQHLLEWVEPQHQERVWPIQDWRGFWNSLETIGLCKHAGQRESIGSLPLLWGILVRQQPTGLDSIVDVNPWLKQLEWRNTHLRFAVVDTYTLGRGSKPQLNKTFRKSNTTVTV